MIKNAFWSPSKVPLFLSDFNETWILWQIFEKYANTKFTENPSSESRVVPYGWTDGRTDRQTKMMKLTFASYNFSNVP